jgi:Transposase
MRLIGCDLHARQQAVAMLDTATGEMVAMTLKHEGNNVLESYSKLPHPVRVEIEATGSMLWFVNLMEELGIECQVGHPANIRAAEPRKQKHDRRDADLILKLLVKNRYPKIWLPAELSESPPAQILTQTPSYSAEKRETYLAHTGQLMEGIVHLAFSCLDPRVLPGLAL